MRNFLAFLAAAVLAFAGVGWYLGWYSVKSTPAGDGQRDVNIRLDTNKIGKDLHNGADKVQNILERNRDQGGNAEAPKAAPR